MRITVLCLVILILTLLGCGGTPEKKDNPQKSQRFVSQEIEERLKTDLILKVSTNKYGAKRVVTIEWRNVPLKTVTTVEIIDWQDNGTTDYLNHTEITEGKIKNFGFYRGGGVIPFINLYALSTQSEINNANSLQNIPADETGIVYENPYLTGLQNKFRFVQIRDYRLNKYFRYGDHILAYAKRNKAFLGNDHMLEYVYRFADWQMKDYPELWLQGQQ